MAGRRGLEPQGVEGEDEGNAALGAAPDLRAKCRALTVAEGKCHLLWAPFDLSSEPAAGLTI